MSASDPVVVSLDLDVFVTPTFHDDGLLPSPRIAPEGYSVADDESVLRYLEHNLNLGLEEVPLRRAITHHDEIHSVLREWTDAGTLGIPFHLVHMDAHTDMGFCQRDCLADIHDLLSCPVADRKSFTKGLNKGNWLLYVLANRWVSMVTCVGWYGHPRLDIMRVLREGKENDQIRMTGVPREVLEELLQSDSSIDSKATESNEYSEPPIPLRIDRKESFSLNTTPTALVLCHSPEFVPECADALFDAITADFVDGSMNSARSGVIQGGDDAH